MQKKGLTGASFVRIMKNDVLQAISDKVEKFANYDRYLVAKRRCRSYENDISAQEEIQIQGSRLQSQNEYGWRKKSIGFQKSKGKKSIISIGHKFVVFSFS